MFVPPCSSEFAQWLMRFPGCALSPTCSRLNEWLTLSEWWVRVELQRLISSNFEGETTERSSPTRSFLVITGLSMLIFKAVGLPSLLATLSFEYLNDQSGSHWPLHWIQSRTMSHNFLNAPSKLINGLYAANWMKDSGDHLKSTTVFSTIANDL